MQRNLQSQAIMKQFAVATGLLTTGQQHEFNKPRRYLWTDAFAVCNYLTFYHKTGESGFLRQAESLVNQVHETLGRHRSDGVQRGWLSALDDDQARLHPTRGGLRIGKKFNERQLGEPPNASLEWEQDGQYFHYLTKWMHALDCLSRATGDGRYNDWAFELARVAHSAFVYTLPGGGQQRMYWKMSVDLSRPLVASMGQHDPLDGLVTYLQLGATRKQFNDWPQNQSLNKEIAEMSALATGQRWASSDPLGIGGLLTDAYKLVYLVGRYQPQGAQRVEHLMQDIVDSLHEFSAHSPLTYQAEHRLAFRELGLAIGLQVIGRIQQHIEKYPQNYAHFSLLESLLDELSCFVPLHYSIENFWLDPAHQGVNSWQQHADIINVMLATSIEPEGYLQL